MFGPKCDSTQWVQEVIESYEGDQEAQELITKLSLDSKAVQDVSLQL